MPKQVTVEAYEYSELTARGKNREECHALLEEFIKEAVLAAQKPEKTRTRKTRTV